MNSWKRLLVSTASCAVFLSLCVGASAEEPGGKTPAASRAAAVAELPIYVPPEIGAAGDVSGGAARGSGGLALRLLAPDHMALTTLEQPTLYWFLSEATSFPVEVTLRDDEAVKPLLEVRLSSPMTAGVHSVRLGEHGIRLVPETRYKWFVSIVPDPERRSRDSSAGAGIMRRESSANLRERLELSAPQGRDVFVYAENGIWYDAIASVSRRIEAAPSDPELRAQRAALLQQVGLSDVAEFDRRQAGAP